MSDRGDFEQDYWRGAPRLSGDRPALAPTAIADDEFRLLAENIPTLCWIANGDGYIVWYNRRWYEYTGTRPDEMEGWGWQSVHDHERLPEVMERWTASIATGEPFEMTFPLRGADGIFRPFLTRVQPVRDTTGAVARWFGVNTDISAQTAAEDGLRESEQRLRTVQAAGRIGSFDYDIQHDRAICSEEWYNVVGLPGGSSVKLDTMSSIVVAEDWSQVTQSLERAIADREPLSVEYRIIRPDTGELRWLVSSATMLLDDDGQPSRYIGGVVDITRRKTAEAALHKLNETLEQRVQDEITRRFEVEEALRQAQKMEAVGQLTGGIAHDFNNLLTGVIGSLDMMQRQIRRGDTEKIERYANTAMTSANRAAALTQRLLAFARRQPIDPKPVNANRLVTGMEELLRRTTGEGIRLEIVAAGGLWLTRCDPHQLESAILNLGINSRDAMPDGGVLTIETCNTHLDNACAAKQRDVAPGQYVCICVTDTGSGMSANTIEKAFEPFFTTKPTGQGTGLGLSMVYGFARQSEGYARIYSEEGRGTTVKVYLPRYHGEADEPEEYHGELANEHRTYDGEVVLVIEDEHAVREFVVEVLEELGYKAIEAQDGPDGLRVLNSSVRIDLLITDIGLPGLNGRQVADAARQGRPDLKILFMTGYAENATFANGFLEPGMEMITKPFAVEALATRVRQMVDTRDSL